MVAQNPARGIAAAAVTMIFMVLMVVSPLWCG
jgi:hypothetical protein